MLFYSTSLFLQMCKLLTTIMFSFCASSLIAFGLSRSLGRSKAKTLSIKDLKSNFTALDKAIGKLHHF